MYTLKYYPLRIVVVLAISATVLSCNGNIKQNTPANKNNEVIKSNDNKIDKHQLLQFDSNNIADFINKFSKLSPYKKQLDSFYSGRRYAFAWFDAKGLIAQAANLYNHIENIKSEGLPDNLPYKNEFKTLMQKEGKDSANKPSVNTELMLTTQYFIYAENVWMGLNQQETKNIKWYLPRNKLLYEQLLDSLIMGKNILDDAPVYRQYSLLKNYLKKYRDIQAAGGFLIIPAGKKMYKIGDSSATIIAIRKWLFKTGDLIEDNIGNIFDTALETGVKNFQQRIGTKEDGVITAALINEMNVPIEKRIEQIIVNMERSRWVPVSLVTNYLVINIPEYRLHAYENNNLVWSMNVVVGKPMHETVIFSGDIKYVVFSPYWNVPTSILKKEVLPGIKKNPNYLSQHQMEWNGNGVRQKPGPDNSLGLVKFLFPNSYNIYLHDTPAKSLFGESDRAFSHGCIRLAEAQKLANYLLQNDATWTPKKIDDAMHTGKEQTVTLTKSEPVFIAYFTSWVDRQGRLNFRKDTYGRDKALAAMLLNKKAF